MIRRLVLGLKNDSKEKKTFRNQIFCVVLIFLALLSWAVSSPVGSSPDDGFHLASIWCAGSNEASKCEPGSIENSRQVPMGVSTAQNCYAFFPEVSAACQIDLGGSEANALIETEALNSAGFYPPVYYRVMSTFAGSDITKSVLLIRFLNCLFYLGLFILTLLISSPKIRNVLMLSQVLVIVPFGLFIVSSINPSSWAFTIISFLWAILWKMLDSDGLQRVLLSLILIGLIVLAAGTRSDCAIWVGISILAVVVMRWSKELFSRYNVCVFAVALAISFLFFLIGGQHQMGISSLSDVRTIPTADLWFQNFSRMPYLITGAIGNGPLGWMDTNMPSIVAVGVPSLLFAYLFQNVGGRTKGEQLSLLLVGITLILAPLYLLNEGNLLIPETFQPRYFLPLIPLITGLFLIRTSAVLKTIGRTQKVLTVLVLAIAHGFAFHTNIRRYVTGVDVLGWNLNESSEWWWSAWIPSPMTVWGVGTLSLATAVVLCMHSIVDLGDRQSSGIITNSVH